MNKNSSIYTFGFAAALVIVVGFLLAGAAIGLKPFQSQNIKLEKMQNILGSVGIVAEPEVAENLFNEHITAQFVLTADGEIVVDGTVTAFDIDLAKEMQKKPDERFYPLFQALKNDSTFMIIPMRGKGLWGPIWGYIALDTDLNVNNVYGAKFDHKSETPGLGAEINTTEFQKQFVGRKIFDLDGNYISVKAVKGGVSVEDIHKVDAISGGTITSNGVNEMIERTLRVYLPFFKAYEADKVKKVSEEEVGTPEVMEPDASGGVSAEEEAGSETVNPQP
jgi:Na+-transporting NADH:ubiquinone oxidoreductase subunit C